MKHLNMIKRLVLSIAVLAAVTAGGLAQAGSCTAPKDIVDTAVAADGFNTLVAAVKAAGLVDVLKDDGPFTVFAPTDEAFARLPEGTLESLLEPENRELLQSILAYHVAPGALTAADVTALPRIKTINGQRPAVTVNGSQVKVGDALVVSANIETSNGIIHVIDRVLLPSADDIVTTAVEAGSFETLAAALKAAGLVSALQGKGPFTVFAPTDEAFGRLADGTLDDLLRRENKQMLQAILKYHVIPGAIYSEDVEPGKVKTLEGSRVTLSARDGNLMVDGAKIVATDISSSNGVIHVIDAVILPQAGRAGSGTSPSREIIELAIDQGAPLYNMNQPRACAAVYRVAVQSLLKLDGADLSGHEERRLKEALREIRRNHDPKEQAWALRRALDDVYRSMSDRMAGSDSRMDSKAG